MKRPLLANLVLGIFLFSGIANAANSKGEGSFTGQANALQADVAPNIASGNFSVGGTVGVGYSTYSKVNYYLSPSVEYFVVDHLSVGGTLSSTVSEQYKSYGIGPSLSYFFWQREKMASFVGVGAFYHSSDYSYPDGLSGNSNFWTGQIKLGLNYFIYPSVAVGPFLNFEHTFASQTNGNADLNSGLLLLQFSVFL